MQHHGCCYQFKSVHMRHSCYDMNLDSCGKKIEQIVCLLCIYKPRTGRWNISLSHTQKEDLKSLPRLICNNLQWSVLINNKIGPEFELKCDFICVSTQEATEMMRCFWFCTHSDRENFSDLHTAVEGSVYFRLDVHHLAHSEQNTRKNSSKWILTFWVPSSACTLTWWCVRSECHPWRLSHRVTWHVSQLFI